MFQYAFYLSKKSKAGKNVYYLVPPIQSHNGFELSKVFNIPFNSYRNLLIRIIKKLSFSSIAKQFEVNPGTFDLEKTRAGGRITYYCGFWQSEKYFQRVKHEVTEAFQFDQTKLSGINKEFVEKIKKKETVSVHVRRGDYETHEGSKKIMGGICNADYYNRAMAAIDRLLPTEHFYIVFSDDITWCRENLLIENAVYVDWNKGTDSWQDMLLMSKCNHNIIANSSFSWWGAYLNANPDKLIICPEKWFNALNTPDITPQSWIKV